MLARSVLCSVLVLSACRREPKPEPRTEPWPAPALSASTGNLPARASYAVTEGHVSVELKVNERAVRGTIPGVAGTLDANFETAEASRGRLRIDLSSLTVEGDPGLTTRAREWLGLTGQDVPEEVRYAELAVIALDDAGRRGPRRSMTAQAELTLNRVRVPVLLELEVERRAGDASAPDSIVARTRRPLSVSLSAHGLPLPAQAGHPGSLDPARLRVAQIARISAEITAHPLP